MMILIQGPDLTFQYNQNGWLSDHGPQVELTENSPSAFRSLFVQKWSVSTPDRNFDGNECFGRLKELVEGCLAKLPDNPGVLCKAWLVGVIDEMPPRYREWLAKDAARNAIEREREARFELSASKAMETGQPQYLDTLFVGTCKANDCDCNGDAVARFVRPDGSIQSDYSCTY